MAFVRGAEMEKLPNLRVLADSFLFLPSVEISIERLHSYVSQRLKIVHSHSPSYISVTLRKSEIVSTHSANTSELISCTEVVPGKRQAVEQLSLHNHPCFESYRRGKTLDAGVPHSLVNKVCLGSWKRATNSVKHHINVWKALGVASSDMVSSLFIFVPF